MTNDPLTVSLPALDLAAARRGAGAPVLRTEAVTLADSERQPCEVWTRVMGYHRPVSSFNTGKQGEHVERRFYRA